MPNRGSQPQVCGNYELLTKIGEGGMCDVYRGRRGDSGQFVAVKILPAHLSGNRVLLKRFEQEFRAATRLDHPNIVRALDFGEDADTPYLVMELVEGVSLGEKVEVEGRLPEAQALGIIVEVCRGLHYAHRQGIIHRDIKPDNVLLSARGEVKITDLGLVKEMLVDQDLTRTGRGLGTPHYMAPEQFRNAKTADVRADVYSLGATLYTLVTGSLPFGNTSPLEAWMKKMEMKLRPPRELAPGLSERTNRVILRAMDPDPGHRPATCPDFVLELTGRPLTEERARAAAPSVHEPWHLFYEDNQGQSYALTQPLERLRRCIQSGLFKNARSVLARRSPHDPFQPLHSFVELRDVAPEPPAEEPMPAAPDPAPPVVGPVEARRPTAWIVFAAVAVAAGVVVGWLLFR